MKGQEDKVLKYKERKKFDFVAEDPTSRIEATTEHPIMYYALGSEPKTEHPYNVYNDIKTEPVAIRKTLEIITESVDIIANEFLKRDIKHIVGIRLKT